MNAQTFTQVVNPVIAVLATPKQHHQRNKQKFKERKKKPTNFDSLFYTACESADDMLLFNDTGCYGKDAKIVVGMVSSFNKAL